MTGLPPWAVVIFVVGAVIVIAALAVFMATHVPQMSPVLP